MLSTQHNVSSDFALGSITGMNETQKKWEAGRLIIAARKSLGLTQADVGKAAGFSRATVAKAEHGPTPGDDNSEWSVTSETLAKIAMASGANVGAVLDAAGYDSNVYSTVLTGNIIDVSGLSDDDLKIVTALVHTIREVRKSGEPTD